MKKISKKKKILLIVLVIFIILVLWTIWGNITIGVTNLEYESSNLPSGFNGFKVVQVSDLHNAKFAERNDYLYNLVKDEEPDIILITGDLVDQRHTDLDSAINVVESLSTLAPTYYVTGNHDYHLSTEVFNSEIEKLKNLGVVVLRNEVRYIEYNNEKITLVGLDDPEFRSELNMSDIDVIDMELSELNLNEEFTLVMSHRPDAFTYYASHNLDLVLTGHAHGGQFRLPLLGGVLVPDQGFFPKYDEGIFESGRTTMYISRGIGNSAFPFRFNNRPEILSIEFKSN